MEARHHHGYTGKGMPQRNQLYKLWLADIAGKAIAMMVQANLSEEIKYKLCKAFNCAMYISNLAMVKQPPGMSIFIRKNHIMPST